MRQPNWGNRLNEASLIERNQKEDGPTSRLGLAIYRCTYEDNDAWDKFMSILRERVRHGLDVNEALDLEDRFEWTVMDDKQDLDGASFGDVCSRLQLWATQQVGVDNVRENCCGARYNFCIYVDRDVLVSVLKTPRPQSFGDRAKAYLILIDARRYMVSGWEPSSTRISLSSLVPRVYHLIDDVQGYEMIYRPNPEVYAD